MVNFTQYSNSRIVNSNERTAISLDEIAVGDYLIRNDFGDDGGQMFTCYYIQIIKKNANGVTVEYDCNGETKKMILKWKKDHLESKSHRKCFHTYWKKEEAIANIDNINISACNYWY